MASHEKRMVAAEMAAMSAANQFFGRLFPIFTEHQRRIRWVNIKPLEGTVYTTPTTSRLFHLHLVCGSNIFDLHVLVQGESWEPVWLDVSHYGDYVLRNGLKFHVIFSSQGEIQWSGQRMMEWDHWIRYECIPQGINS